jgi:hypothetical protein
MSPNNLTLEPHDAPRLRAVGDFHHEMTRAHERETVHDGMGFPRFSGQSGEGARELALAIG